MSMFSDFQLLHQMYAFFRRIRNDGASLYRSFLFAYVEHIWVTRDNTEVDRIGQSLTLCQWTNDIRGNICANFEELREMFLQLLYEHIREESRPRSHKEFLSRSLRQWDSASSGTFCSPLNFLCLLFVQCSLMCLLGQSFHS
ncbi:unnamed protein product [Musa acuminata subsp. burmannicoides]